MSEKSKLCIMIVGGNFIGKGAEAMMLTVRDAIQEAFPSAVCCVVPLSEVERKQLEKHGFRAVRRQRQSLVRKILKLILTKTRLVSQQWIDPITVDCTGIANVFLVSHVIVDISGFASSDQYGSLNAFRRWMLYHLAKCARNKVVFMPQSWGPFKDLGARVFTRFMLRNSELVCAREKVSLEYLLDARCVPPDKALLFPDIAFQFHASPPEAGQCILNQTGLYDRNRPIITITPNMRIFERTPGRGIDNVYLSELTNIIKYFLHETSCQIILIPHEASFRRMNDAELCRMLIEQTRDHKRIFMLTGEESAADIKSVIGLSDFLVASRYHSLIAALSMRVPVAVIGWSHKYNEVMREVGLEQWVVDAVSSPEGTTNQTIIEAWHQRESIHIALKERVPELEKKSSWALERMIKIIRYCEVHRSLAP